MKKFFTILGFEYLTCIRNKAFIIITAFLVCASLLFAFLPEVITSLTSEDEQQIDDKPPAIALKKSVYDDELLKSSFSAAFPGYEIVISDDERKEIESKVDDGTYTFAVDITAPNAFTYITKNQTLYNSDQQYITEIIKHMFEKTELEKQGVSPEKTDEILGMSYFSELVTTGADITKNYFPVYIIMMKRTNMLFTEKRINPEKRVIPNRQQYHFIIFFLSDCKCKNNIIQNKKEGYQRF